MSYNDEEKRHFVLGKFIEFLNTLDTWDKVKIFISGISTAKIKARLKEAFQDSQAESDVVIGDEEQKKINDSEMESEIENL